MIDPIVGNTAMKNNMAQERNKQKQGLQQRATAAPGNQKVAKPNIGQPAVALGVNKKKPLLARGSVRANAARESNMMRDRDLQMQQTQNQAGQLDLAPTQLPFVPQQDMGVIGPNQDLPQDPNMMAPQINNALPGQLNVGPSQLPFGNTGIAGGLQLQEILAQMRAGQSPEATPMNAGIGADPRIMAAQQRNMLQQRQQMQGGLQQGQRNFRQGLMNRRNQMGYGRG